MKNNERDILEAKIRKLQEEIDILRASQPDEVYLTSDQMERLLRCSPATLYRLRKNRSIPCVQIGRQYRYPKKFFTQEVINSIIKPEDPSKRFDDE